MDDPTEGPRRIMQYVINVSPVERLEKDYPTMWTTEELQRDFTVEGFAAPFVLVTRKADGAHGTLLFKHSPRVYFDFVEDRP
jgi:hypothetical protein